MTIQEVVAQFNTTPFIFAGSGISRRYYGLPDWRGLLTVFAKKINPDDFSYLSYENRAKQESETSDYLPLVASLIEKDFNEAWFNNCDGIRSESDKVCQSVSAGTSPFKAELCHFIASNNQTIESYNEEIEKLKKLAKSNIAGVITTNYDAFFESIFTDYKTFVGQDELVFSQLQGIAEIYKIHGSISNESSIIINRADYQLFSEKSKYLAAKLMTIFMEYPIVFMGYSITDSDIRDILKNIVECLPKERLPLMRKRFIFVEYDENEIEAVVSSHSMVFESKTIEMTKITLSDFGMIYEALSKKKAAFPVKILRRFKEELYSFALTSEPSETMRVAPLEDERIDEDMLAITIGLASTGTYGLARAVDSEKWYRNVILHDSQYTADQLLEFVYVELAKQNSWKLPVWYYLSEANDEYEEIKKKAPNSYNEIVSVDAIKRNNTAIKSRSMIEVWNQEKSNLSRALRILVAMPYEKVEVDDLERVLKEIFEKMPDCLSSGNTGDKSNVRKLIRIYDFLKYKK